MKEKHLLILSISICVLILMVISAFIMEQYCKHQAVVHHAAFYEADSWGNVSFHWNDVSFAQTPFKN